MTSTWTATERTDAADMLRNLCPENASIYAVRLHTAKSGATHDVTFFVVSEGRAVGIDWLICRILGLHISPVNSGVRIKGGGMDMAYHVIDSLSRALYGKGYAIGHGVL